MVRTVTAVAFLGLFWTVSGTSHEASAPSNSRSTEFGPWSAPVHLGPIVNSTVQDTGPAISRDGLSLFLHSARHSAGADFDLYVSRRLAIDLPWGAPVNLGAVLSSPSQDVTPNLSSDGRYLFFASLRTGHFDIYVSQRHDRHNDFGWEAPAALPSPVNGPSFDVAPQYFENTDGRPQLYFSSDRANALGQAGLDIYISELRKSGSWSAPVFVAELNSAFEDGRTTIRSDGLEIVFNSNREGTQDLYVSRRNHVWEPWSIPESLGPAINTSASESQPALSANGRTLYFSSTRPGGLGVIDLYASTRSERRRSDHRDHDGFPEGGGLDGK